MSISKHRYGDIGIVDYLLSNNTLIPLSTPSSKLQPNYGGVLMHFIVNECKTKETVKNEKEEG